MSAQLEKILELTGLKRDNDIAYGSQNDIYVNVVYNKLTWSAFVYFFINRENGISAEEINLFLNENRKKYRAKMTAVDGDIVTVMLNSEVKRIKPEDVAVFLSDATAFLKKNGYLSGGCSVCSQDSDEGYTLHNGFVRPMCAPCHEKVASVTTDIKHERATTGSYLTGLLGAVLGAIIGIIPWVLIGMLGYIASISGLAMAYLSYKGYLLLRGKRGPGMTWILIIVLIVFTYIAVLTSEVAGGYQDLAQEGFTLSEMILLVIILPYTPFGTPLWGNIALGWVFAGIGSFSFLRKARKEAVGAELTVTRVNDNVNM